jgi:methylated-DNA-[protein]-cysteine S-methyltransferase
MTLGTMTDASYALVDAPWGPIHVAATSRGVAALEVMTPTDMFLDRLRDRGLDPQRSRAAGTAGYLDDVVAALESYLEGGHRTFDQQLDPGPQTAWDRAVLLDGVRSTPWGRVTSYGRVARRIGRPGAARAVGGAVGRNPIGILVPCHRVIAGDGSIGGYGGAWMGTRDQMLAIKRELLAIEGIDLPVRSFDD